MRLQKVDKLQWRNLCDQMSSAATDERPQVEIASPDEGVQWQSHWQSISRVEYDSHDDSIEFLLDDAERVVLHPHELYVDYGNSGLECVGIVNDELAWQIILLRDPLRLPAPDAFSPHV